MPRAQSAAGDFVDGNMTGNGTKHFADGAVYAGEFRNNSMTGWGVLTFNDSSSYEGEFQRGAAWGTGTLHRRNGIRFTTTWVDGVSVATTRCE